MAISVDMSRAHNDFIGLELKKGKEFYSKRDSGERGGKLEDSRKDKVPNPELKGNKGVK